LAQVQHFVPSHLSFPLAARGLPPRIMGQTSCSYWSGEDGAELPKEVQADLSTSETPSAARLPGKPAGRSETAFRPPSEMLKALKSQEGKKVAQERWATTKAGWEANVLAQLEKTQAAGTQPDRYAPDERALALQAIREEEAAAGTQPDRYAPDERKLALQAIREEEEERSRASADGDRADDTQGVAPKDESAKVLEEIEASPAVAVATDDGGSAKREAPQENEQQQEQQQELLEDISPVEDSGEQAAERKAILEAFLAKNGFDGVSNKRRRTLRTSMYPLHLAAEKGDARLIDLLLEAGADRLLTDSLGRTPQEVAAKKNRKGSHDEALAALASL